MILERGSGADATRDDALEGPAPTNRIAHLMDEMPGMEEAVGLGTDPGLGLLLELAKRGEYDPWNVDVVQLTDRYLEALDSDRMDAADLGRVARLIFYAAALVHLKAQALADKQKELDYQEALEQTLAEELGDLLGDGPAGSRLLPGDQPLEYGFLGEGGGLGGFSPRERPLRNRGLTLVDLIAALREYDERLAKREAELAEAPVFDEAMVIEECVGSSHQDDLDQDIIDIRLELWRRLEETDAVPFESLITPTRPKAAAFLALLFLSHDEEVLLEQDEFYGPIAVRRGAHFGEIRAGVAHDGDAGDGDDDDSDDDRAALEDDGSDETSAYELIDEDAPGEGSGELAALLALDPALAEEDDVRARTEVLPDVDDPSAAEGDDLGDAEDGDLEDGDLEDGDLDDEEDEAHAEGEGSEA